eukprot:2398812-Amphidinium_carterae.2
MRLSPLGKSAFLREAQLVSRGLENCHWWTGSSLATERVAVWTWLTCAFCVPLIAPKLLLRALGLVVGVLRGRTWDCSWKVAPTSEVELSGCALVPKIDLGVSDAPTRSLTEWAHGTLMAPRT